MPMKTEHPNDGCTPLEAASTNKVPTIGPVQEKDTIASANAINKIPIIPPYLLGYLLYLPRIRQHNFKCTQECKTTNKTKKIILNQTLVDKAFNASAPKIQVTKILEEHK
jgi:hypothetical protein